jgi:hypothetical protein
MFFALNICFSVGETASWRAAQRQPQPQPHLQLQLPRPLSASASTEKGHFATFFTTTICHVLKVNLTAGSTCSSLFNTTTRYSQHVQAPTYHFSLVCPAWRCSALPTIPSTGQLQPAMLHYRCYRSPKSPNPGSQTSPIGIVPAGHHASGHTLSHTDATAVNHQYHYAISGLHRPGHQQPHLCLHHLHNHHSPDKLSFSQRQAIPIRH